MRKQGRIASWFDDKGYGFIEPLAGGPRVFLHISAIDDRGRRPSVGDTVTYGETSDKKGRLRADRATLTGSQTAGPDRRSLLAAGVAVVLIVALVVALTSSASLYALVAAVYLVASPITFGFYAFDKAAARRGCSRIPESTLHALAVAGGWPGALVAQRLLRHKTRKQPFRAVFWLTVLINLVVLGWLWTGDGQAYIDAMLESTRASA